MGIATSIALFVGLPAVAIVALGFLFTRFRGQILGSASAVGETFAGIFTRPISGAIETISTAFTDLPDIDIRLPGINISSGVLTFTQEAAAISPGNIIPGTDMLEPGVTSEGVTIPEGCTLNPDGTISCPTPPSANLFPEAAASELEIFCPQCQFSVDGAGIRTTQQIIEQFPEAVGLFDLPQTQRVEFLPLGVEAISFFQEAGVTPKLSGQLFEEFPTVSDIPLG